MLLRRRLPAPPPRLDARSTAGRSSGIHKIDRRREDLEEAHERAAQGGDGPHRPRRSPHEARHASTPWSRPPANKAGGIFRSTDRGESWEKRGDYVPGGPQYYQEIFVDPQGPRARLLGGRVPAGHGRRRQDLAQRSASATSTWTTTRSGSTPTTPTTTSWAATAGCTRASTAGRPGSAPRTCPSRSSTGWPWTTPRPSTTSTAARRTTTPWAARRAPERRTASPTTTGS